VEVYQDTDADGAPRYFVTPWYRRDAQVLTVPDDHGGPTLAEAMAHARRYR
jgi:hypothetical protein